MNITKKDAKVMGLVERKFELHERYFKYDYTTLVHLVYLQQVNITQTNNEEEVRKDVVLSNTEKILFDELPQLEQLCLQTGDIQNSYEVSSSQAKRIQEIAQFNLDKLLEIPKIIREED
ncbi:hypothetical protein [Ornithinibacillus scapharcae]|uniref:hypothetical protein n=1 Tax=Ornithinibacillus scapharcae TaxID=1147159 RepID=UPI000225B26C|nr:hypothetical protein [Ornithinibacillus scapharcae]